MVLRWPQWACVSNESGLGLIGHRYNQTTWSMLLSRHACVSLCKKKRAGNQFLVLGQARQSLFGQGGAGGQYGEVVTNIALFVTHETQYHRIVWPDPSTSFEVYSGKFCLWAQAAHLEVQAARLTMQGVTRLFKIRGFPGGVFSSHFSFFTSVFVTKRCLQIQISWVGQSTRWQRKVRSTCLFKISDG